MAVDEGDQSTADPEEQPRPVARQSTTLRAAIAAHLGGAPWDWIAQTYGYSSPSRARVAIEGAMGETYNNTDLTAARNKARARYERLLRGIWNDATQPFLIEDGEPTDKRNELHHSALDRARGLIGDLARLDGLNAPAQLQVYTPGSEEMLQYVGEIRRLALGEMPREADIWDAEIEEDEKNGDEA